MLAFSQPWGFADTECRKKISFQKNGFGQDVEQLSHAAKAQYPFLRAESATFRVAKAFCSTFCPFFVFLFVKYLCMPERRLVIGYIYKKEDCDCRYCLYCRRRKCRALRCCCPEDKIRMRSPSSMKTTKKAINSIRKEKTNMKAIITRNDQTTADLPDGACRLFESDWHQNPGVHHPLLG